MNAWLVIALMWLGPNVLLVAAMIVADWRARRRKTMTHGQVHQTLYPTGRVIPFDPDRRTR